MLSEPAAGILGLKFAQVLTCTAKTFFLLQWWGAHTQVIQKGIMRSPENVTFKIPEYETFCLWLEQN